MHHHKSVWFLPFFTATEQILIFKLTHFLHWRNLQEDGEENLRMIFCMVYKKCESMVVESMITTKKTLIIKLNQKI